MPEFTGKDMVINWVWSGGTLSLTSDQHSFTYTPSVKKFQTRTGNEAAETYQFGATDFTAQYDGLAQTGGTAINAALAIGVAGTLTVAPEGTASGKPKYVFPCISDKDPVTAWNFDDLTHINASWQGNGVYQVTNY